MTVVSLKKNQIGRVKSLDFNNLTRDTEAGLWDAEIKALMENRTLKGLFFSEDWVFIVLDLIASEISNAEMPVWSKNSDGKMSVLPEHPLSKMVQNPNEWQDYSTWMYLHVVELNLMGNAIQWFAENTMQMIILPADLIHLNFSEKTKKLASYMAHSDGDQFIETGEMDSMVFPVEDVLHQRRPNPSNMLWGLSPFIPNAKSILFNRYTSDYLNSYYLKGATPQMALHMEKNASEDSALRMLRSFEMSYTGRRNQRRTLVLPKGVKAETMSHSIGDQKLVDIANLNMEKIINILRVPKHALSLARAGSLGSEEHKQALKFMHTSAINPQKKKIEGTFTAFFRARGLLKENEFFKFDNSNVEILKEDEIKRADLAKKQMGVKTVNEIRESLYGLPALSGGDVVILAPGQYAGEAANLTAIANPTVPNAPEAESEERQVDTVKALLDTKYKDWWVKNQENINNEVENKEERFLELVLDIFATSTELSLEVIKEVLGPRTKDDEEDLEKISKAIAEIWEEIEKQYEQSYNAILRATVEVGYNTNLFAIFNQPHQDAIAAIGARNSEQRRAILAARGIKSFKDISKTSTEAVMAVIEDGLKKNRTTAEIADLILSNPKTGIDSPDRAKKIARTEVLTAISIGKAANMRDAQKVIEGLKKVWITAADERVRDTHRANQKQGPIDVNKEFKNGLKYPRDLEGEAKEIIRCRCDLLIIPPEDLADLEIPEVR